MNKKLLHGAMVLTVCVALSPVVLAKPESSQKDKQGDERSTRTGSSHEQPGHQDKSLERQRKSMPDRDDAESLTREHRNDGNNYRHADDDVTSGLAKQRHMKAGQAQKESGRGSEIGQEMREDHRRKWWKFWE